jgi:DNA polymerase III delta subunit
VIAFIHGPDRFLAREAVVAFAADIDPDGANTTWVDARESGTQQIRAMIGAASFFGAPRVVIVTNLLGRAPRNAEGSSQGTGKSSAADAELKAVLTTVPEQNCLILFEPDLGAPPAAIKSATPPVTVFAGEPPRGSALLAWIEQAAALVDSRFDRGAAQLLAETLFPQTWDRKPVNPRYDRPPDMALLHQEIAKLALAAHPDPIRRDHITALVTSGPDQRVFRFLDAATAGELRAAQEELQRLESAGEEPAMLLAQLFGQIGLMAVASAAAGREASVVVRDLGSITPSRMSAVASAARRRRLPVAESLVMAAAIDRQLKTGRIRRPEEALQQALLALAAPDYAHETGRSR